MIPQIAFNLLDVRQVNSEWIQLGCGVEGHIFDGFDFIDKNCFNNLENSIQIIKNMNPKKLTLHFPTSNASYIDNDKMLNNLFRFIEIALKYDIEVLTLHTNDFVKVEDYKNYNISKRKSMFISLLDKLDKELKNTNLYIGIENIPIIGNEADEFDPLFVMPDSFQDIKNFSNIKTTFDICHWLITYYTLKSIALLKREDFILNIDDFLEISNIIHFHFSSFRNLLIPYSEGICQEGLKPYEGLPEESVLLNILKSINSKYPKNIGIVFEVVENCYMKRKNAFLTLEWFKKAIGD
ncbi:MAG: hypothetical protein FWF57_10355 [Defluviitaleaceae bacterium]|nr:hypothetical protein [Defluviitaleaceae bacterium]